VQGKLNPLRRLAFKRIAAPPRRIVKPVPDQRHSDYAAGVVASSFDCSAFSLSSTCFWRALYCCTVSRSDRRIPFSAASHATMYSL